METFLLKIFYFIIMACLTMFIISIEFNSYIKLILVKLILVIILLIQTLDTLNK